jgi:hypothetical protein
VAMELNVAIAIVVKPAIRIVCNVLTLVFQDAFSPSDRIEYVIDNKTK